MNKAVIMAGGFGTRLRPLTMTIPKPMVKVKNLPMMEHIVNLLKKHDITEIVSVLYFQPEVIRSYFEDGSDHGINMEYVMAQADYGTAGAVRNAAENLKEPFIIISGDVLTDFDLTAAIEFHKKKKAKATILLTRVKKPLQFGIVMTDDDGKIIRFLEKPSWGQVFSDTINTGIYILEPEVLDLIPYQEEFDFSKDLFPAMLHDDIPLYGYVAEGYWRDIGNLNEYQFAQHDTIHDRVKMYYDSGINNIPNLNQGKNCIVPESCHFSGSNVIGDNCIIGEHSNIKNCVIGDNSKIGNGTILSGVTVWDNTVIGDFCEMTDVVICSDCEIGSSVVISENVFIADRCIIGNSATLLSNIKLWPDKSIEQGAVLSRSLVQEEKWSRELFTDARISGLSNTEIHPEFGAKLGAAIGMSFGSNITILASRDPDNVSRIMKRSITAGMASVGVNVNDIQTISIPQTRQELRSGKFAGGIHIRKSPRDPRQTDIIIFNCEGRDISISTSNKIERYFFGEDIRHVDFENVGVIRYPERTNEIYIDRFLNSLNIDLIINDNYKILVDYSYGLASTIFPYILGKLNTEALSLHGYVDGSRYRADPTMEKTASDEAEKIMHSLGYKLGFIIEPGAEKISVIDDMGKLCHPMRLLTIVTKLFLETNRQREPYKIAVSIVAGSEIEEIAKDYDVEVIRIKNSHSAMMENTRDENILFVGGIWGGFIFTDFLYAADGIYSVGKVLEMLSETGLSLTQLEDELPKRVQHTSNVHCPWDFKGTVMRHAMEYSAKFKRELIEGVKIFMNNNSVLLLPGKEKQSFQVIAESDDYDTAIEINNNFSKLIEKWMQEK
ncbi:MAG: sugar phosphate nucleotidyltransferase [Candidatus Kapabacteria bacterium]|jgi:mannose-1-phosphate guanylyltransferase/phosphomannomutase|nr:sugar phosphate nucleotidyltransferase [Candidatus Kapabacteria bacterium]